MRLYFHSTRDVMERVVHDGFSPAMSIERGIRLTATSPVMLGELVIVMDIPDDVASKYVVRTRPGEYDFPAGVLNSFIFSEGAATSRGRT